MRKLLLITIAIIALIGIVSGSAQAQNVFRTTTPSVIAYYESLPADYHQNSDKYPVVIFLHGIGERGPNTTNKDILDDYIYKVAKLGPPMHVKNGTKFPFILISPQLKSNYGTWPSGYVMEVINHVKRQLRIDEKRIYLTGLSLGGGGVWVAAQDQAQVFAAIAPVCGGYNSTSKAINLAKENLPVWGFHGDADDIVHMSKTINMVNAINNSTPKPSPLAKVTIYPGVKHAAWSPAYKTDHSIHTPNVYEWLLSFTNTKNAGNLIPTAKAGADIARALSAGTTITLLGSGADTDGTISSYQWCKLSGPSASLSATTTKDLKVTGLTKGTYTFALCVKDNAGNTDTDYVKLVIY